MSFWNKLGKIALQAAPYVAAPFTGGASLYAIPATQKLGQKWAEHDANEAISKGLAPSKFDKYLGMASSVAGMASGTGALGKFGSAAYSSASGGGNIANQLSGWQNKVKQGGQIASMMAGGSPYAGQANYTGAEPQNEGGMGGWQGQLAGLMSGGGGEQTQTQTQTPAPVSRAYNPIEAGRQTAMMNQPFRAGYTQTIPTDNGGTTTNQMPPIYPQYSDALTQTYGRRRRNPAQEVAQ